MCIIRLNHLPQEGGGLVLKRGIHMALILMYITNNPEVALVAERNGIERIWVDLEKLGKEARQPGNTVKSNHVISDISRIKPLLTKSEMLVRINPWNEQSFTEIDNVVQAGADLIMLPMWKRVDEVESFIKAVNRRAKTVLLLETREAEVCLDDVLGLNGIDEIHIGLNDLHLSYGLSFMFELLANGTVERICKKIAEKGIPYGFGGIANLGMGALPAEKVIAEHYRLGSTRAILSRSFCDTSKVQDLKEVERIFEYNVKELRLFEETLKRYTQADFDRNRKEVIELVDEIVQTIKGKP